jgi:putative membrane protein
LEASLLLGLLNAFVRPLLMLISLPLLIFSLGLFVMVINAVLLSLVGGMLQPGFVVDGFMSAFWGGVIISLVSLVVNGFLGGRAKIQFQGSIRGSTGRRRPKKKDEDGGGPLIDV